MPPRDPNLRLQDIAEAIDFHSLESFAADRKTIDAVVRPREADRPGDPLVRLDGVSKADVLPRLAAVGRLEDAVTHTEIQTMQSLAGADVDDVGIGPRDADVSDRPRSARCRRSAATCVRSRRSSHAAGVDDSEDVRLRRDADAGDRPTGAEGSVEGTHLSPSNSRFAADGFTGALGHDVALKILPDLFAGDPERVLRFTLEAKTLAALNHPNIAAIYGIEGNALVMELVE